MDNQRIGCWGHMASPGEPRQTFIMIISNCLNLVTEKCWGQLRKFIKMFCWHMRSAMPCHHLVGDANKMLVVWAFYNFGTVICTFCIVNNCCYSFFNGVINFFVDSQTIRMPAAFHLAMTDYCSSKCVTNIVVPWGTFLVRDLTTVYRSTFVQ